MPTWKLVSYSAAIIATPFLGHALGDISNVRYLRQVVESIPVLVCLGFVLRLSTILLLVRIVEPGANRRKTWVRTR